MADKKISQLTSNPGIDGTEVMPTAKAGSNFKNTLTALKTWIISGITGFLKTDGTTTGATSQAQEFTSGVEVTAAIGGNKTWVHQDMVRAGNNTNQVEAYMDSATGVVWSVDNGNSTGGRLNPNGSIASAELLNGVYSLSQTKHCKVILTDAQLRAGKAQPIDIIPAPEGNQIIRILDVVAHLVLTGDVYSLGTSLYIHCSTLSGFANTQYQKKIENLLNQNADSIYYGIGDLDNIITIVPGDSIQVSADSDSASGDNFVLLYITYQIINL